ncbi:hypothetical protein BN871_DT_00020 [Paenibacillus sp. P22]|nr:hypothetical protein BN871_DT_00020 [Paenibacillus sp. P22]
MFGGVGNAAGRQESRCGLSAQVQRMRIGGEGRAAKALPVAAG